MSVQNPQIQSYDFLCDMYNDDYFPTELVDKIKAVLLDACAQIEQNPPADLDALYTITHAATKKINELEDEFDAADSELETAARECIAENFAFIAQAYGFEGADIEELIAPREW